MPTRDFVTDLTVKRSEAMNVKLLRKIQKHILAEPRRYWQDTWITGDEDRIKEINGSVPDCKTMACIGGWACILGSNALNASAGELSALLGVDNGAVGRLIDYVGYTDPENSSWPRKYVTAYAKAKTPAGRARVAVRRIDHFIKTKGAE
jgi:hypothetical protein